MRTAATRLARGGGQHLMPAGVPTRCSLGWARGCAAVPEGFGFLARCGDSVSATRSALLSLLTLVFWGRLWGKGKAPVAQTACPELPARSLGTLLN